MSQGQPWTGHGGSDEHQHYDSEFNLNMYANDQAQPSLSPVFFNSNAQGYQQLDNTSGRPPSPIYDAQSPMQTYQLAPVPDYKTPLRRSGNQSGESSVPSVESPMSRRKSSNPSLSSPPGTSNNFPGRNFNELIKAKRNPTTRHQDLIGMSIMPGRGGSTDGTSVEALIAAGFNGLPGVHDRSVFALAAGNQSHNLAAFGPAQQFGAMYSQAQPTGLNNFGGLGAHFCGQAQVDGSRPGSFEAPGRLNGMIAPQAYPEQGDLHDRSRNADNQAPVNQATGVQNGAVSGKGKDKATFVWPSTDLSTQANTINTLSDATKQLRGEGTLILEIKVEGDDFIQVKQAEKTNAEKILDVILAEPSGLPTTVSTADEKMWWSKQREAVKKCMSKTESIEDQKDALAHCIIVVNTAIEIHKNGISVRFLQADAAKRVQDETEKQLKEIKPVMKTKSKYAIDRFIKCSERIDEIVTAVRDNKQIALDVLAGEMNHVRDLVCAPKAYQAQKRQHFGNNKRKGEIMDAGKNARSKPNDNAGSGNGTSNATGSGADGGGQAQNEGLADQHATGDGGELGVDGDAGDTTGESSFKHTGSAQ